MTDRIFSNIRVGALEYLRAEHICAHHCFTTRLGGVSGGHLSSLNLGAHRGDDPQNIRENYRILGQALGFDPEKCVLTRQTHSNIVRAVTEADCMGLDHGVYPECDGLVTNTPGLSLVIFTADCTPILLYDPVTGAVGAAHAGWRGTAGRIAENCVKEMQRQFGCDPRHIRAAIGPNIGGCCFETDADVPEALIAACGSEAEAFICPQEDKYYVNLKEINALILRQAGVQDIAISDECTMCRPDRFWSHRYTRGVRGSQGAIITCKEGAM